MALCKLLYPAKRPLKRSPMKSPGTRMDPKPIEYVVRSGDLNEVKRLLQAGADVMWEERAMGITLIPLAAASDTDDPELLRLMIIECAHAEGQRQHPDGMYDITYFILMKANIRDAMEQTPLHWAAAAGNRKCVNLLIGSGLASLPVRDFLGRTALHRACEGSHTDVAVDLIQAGLDPDKPDDLGRTPLYFAAQVGNERLVKFLVDYGVSIEPNRTAVRMAENRGRDADDVSAIEVAVRSNHTQIVDLLITRLKYTKEKLQAIRHKIVEQAFDDQLKSVSRKQNRKPHCFICYAWGSHAFGLWVERLARHLKQGGVKPILDIWDNLPGSRIADYIEKINRAEFVVLIGTPGLRRKFEAARRKEANPVIAAELARIDSRLMKSAEERDTVIPILRRGTPKSAFHSTISDYTIVWSDFTRDNDYWERLLALIGVLRGIDDSTIKRALLKFNKAREEVAAMTDEEIARRDGDK